MGVEFKVNYLTTEVINSITVNKPQRTSQFVYPLLAITKLDDTGVAQKYQTPYKTDSGAYQTIWIPAGQQGWTIEIQATLIADIDTNDTGFTATTLAMDNPIYSWLMVDTGMILEVTSNQIRRTNGIGGYAHDSNHPAISKLPKGSYWYVDKVVLASKPGYINVADLQLTLVRCWGT